MVPRRRRAPESARPTTHRRPKTDLFFSWASLWEIAIKHSLGKLPLSRPVSDLFPAQLDTDGVTLLPLETTHLSRLIDIPLHHRGPFDRLIIAQAMVEGVPVLTRDRAFADYPVELGLREAAAFM